MLTKNDILDKLKTYKVPHHDADVVSLNMVEDVQVYEGGAVHIVLKVDPEDGAVLEPFRQDMERDVALISGVKSVNVIMTAERKQPAPVSSAPDPHGMNKNPKLNNLPIRNIIAVASGKGGVGKSTVALNLAVELARQGLSTGILDADIYGPSVPRLTGLPYKKPEQENGKIIPFTAHGVQVMSIGFMVKPEQALIWRGPMVQTALYQMFRDVAWGKEGQPLDYLIVDMPPGTGDAQLTLAQKIPVMGAVIVSTPQDLALIDARKAVEMFEKVDVPILGVVENMSTYICPECGHEDHIFGHGGAKDEAERLGVPFLGAIPLTMETRRKSDDGTPLENEVFRHMIKQLVK